MKQYTSCQALLTGHGKLISQLHEASVVLEASIVLALFKPSDTLCITDHIWLRKACLWTSVCLVTFKLPLMDTFSWNLSIFDGYKGKHIYSLRSPEFIKYSWRCFVQGENKIFPSLHTTLCSRNIGLLLKESKAIPSKRGHRWWEMPLCQCGSLQSHHSRM